MPKEQTKQHYARFVIPGEGTLGYCGAYYDRGALVPLQGIPKDEALLRLGYIAEVPHPRRVCQCGVCGVTFMDEVTRDAHGRRRHRNRFTDDLDAVSSMEIPGVGVAAVRDTTGDAEEQRLMAEAPLYLDQTIASKS